jgi:gliding motility-associated-like protein
MAGDESDYTYTWLPSTGQPNSVGNSRSGLAAGIYTIVVVDPQAPSCLTKVVVELTKQGSCIDTVYVSVDETTPVEVCLDQVLDLQGNITSATLCGFDPAQIANVTLDQDGPCVMIDPSEDFTGETTICVIHCDDAQPANCDTTYIVLKLDNVNPPCEDVLINAFAELTIPQCDLTAALCLDIAQMAFQGYNLTVNGVVYNGPLSDCNNGDGAEIQLGEGVHVLVLTNQLNGCSDTMTVTVFCDDIQTELVAVDDQASVLKNKTILINVLNNDIIPGNDLGNIYIVNQPAHGKAELTEDYQIVYTPDAEYCGEDAFQYVICNEFMCDTATVSINVICAQIMVHNGFSPNGDGVNDYFNIDGIGGFPNNELTIFNRWGNQVYYAKGYKNNWDGTWDGGNLPDGTYFYILEDGEGQVLSGYLQINR